jgi:hypothetical protein
MQQIVAGVAAPSREIPCARKNFEVFWTPLILSVWNAEQDVLLPKTRVF